MPAYNANLAKFAGFDAQVVGISPDSVYSHINWQLKDIGKLDYPLLSDFYPHGAVAQKYGILREGDPIPGITERAVFVVDKQGKLAFAQQYELGQQPENEDVFEALAKLK
jgi:peroxiredoxin